MPKPESKAARIIKLAETGMDHREIAVVVGSPYTSVRTVVSDANKRWPPRPGTKASRIIALALSGHSGRDIAAAIGSEIDTVHAVVAHAKTRGIDIAVPRPKLYGPRTPFSHEDIIAAAVGGESPIDIATRLGLKPTAVRNVLGAARKRGVAVPDFKPGRRPASQPPR